MISQMSREQIELEIERRAYALVHRDGRPGLGPRRLGLVYRDGRLFVWNGDHEFEVRVADPLPSKQGIRCYELAWKKIKSSNATIGYVDKMQEALYLLRALMILDDLADA